MKFVAIKKSHVFLNSWFYHIGARFSFAILQDQKQRKCKKLAAIAASTVEKNNINTEIGMEEIGRNKLTRYGQEKCLAQVAQYSSVGKVKKTI